MTNHTCPSVVPDDESALLVARVWDAQTNGPRIAAVHRGQAWDLSEHAGTMSEFLERPDAADILRTERGVPRWSLEALTDASCSNDRRHSRLLSPIDLQVIKACGVTFVESPIERVIEEASAGDPSKAASVRVRISEALGGRLGDVVPGSESASAVKALLQREGLWSQYLEVGIGPDPEVFTKAPILSSVGYGAGVGIPAFSEWSNPEPELVIIADSRGNAVGATLGNDVNLRDVEGRSALLLGMAKDNNASAALGPFIRVFDDRFGLEQLRVEEIALRVDGPDGFVLTGVSGLSRISRPFEELMQAVRGTHHQYPDGYALYTGTLFAPIEDRDQPGRGFTHMLGDVVSISSPSLGTLVNTVGRSEELPPWEFGLSDLYHYLRTLPMRV